MYFAVLEKSTGNYIVLPKEWIFGLKMENIVNSGLSRRVYRCFYSTNPDAFDDIGAPCGEYPSRFDIPTENIPGVSGDVNIFGQLKRCFG